MIQIASARGEYWPAWWEALVRGQGALAEGGGTAGAGRIAFAVRVLASGALAGTSSFLFVDARHGTCEVGATWFRPEYWGGVVNLEAKLLMLSEAFQEKPSAAIPTLLRTAGTLSGSAPPPLPSAMVPLPEQARSGFKMVRVAFRVDERNGRSLAALGKLGAVREGVARDDFLTWTGHRRSSVVFSILAGEWRDVRAGLEARLEAFGTRP